ncbi:MAG: lysophospholipid acyltransferase family protein [Candidatus Omnitrophota bacterium]
MKARQVYKNFIRRIGRNTFYLLRKIMVRLPYGILTFVAPLFIRVGKLFLKKRKRVVLENLRAVYKDSRTEREIGSIASAWFDNISLGMIELIYLIDRPGEIVKRVSIEGAGNLDEALAKGRGVILLGAHFGDFALVLLRLALAGYKVNCIMRRMKDAQFGEYVFDYCKNNGVRIIYSIPYVECVKQSLRCLKNNEVLFILLDQNYGDRGRVFVDFFGRPAATATGPVIFSYRSGAPILPAFAVRDSEKNHKIIIDPPVKLEAQPEEELSVERNVEQLTKIIEGYIRRYPQEWGGWMHKRWKTKQTDAGQVFKENAERGS